jgi:hypothetical protein
MDIYLFPLLFCNQGIIKGIGTLSIEESRVVEDVSATQYRETINAGKLT